MPTRIQRKRTAGWKLPANAKCVTRPGRFGNPFIVDEKKAGHAAHPMARSTAEQAVAEFERHVVGDARLREIIRTELRGFDLACYCKPGEPCHADVLLRIANT